MIFWTLWVISGVAGAIWICAKFTPAMVRDLSYGNSVELMPCILVLLLGLCGILLGAMMGPFVPGTFAAALLLQRALNRD